MTSVDLISAAARSPGFKRISFAASAVILTEPADGKPSNKAAVELPASALACVGFGPCVNARVKLNHPPGRLYRYLR